MLASFHIGKNLSDPMTKKPEHEKTKQTPVFVKYMGLSFQLFGVIGGGTWIGWWIQQKSEMTFPFWLLFFCLISTCIAFYQLWQTVQRDNR